jgi:hypothetical protein
MQKAARLISGVVRLVRHKKEEYFMKGFKNGRLA